MNNKHAKNLQTMLALLPPEVGHVYRDTIYDAAAELNRLHALLAERSATQEKSPVIPQPQPGRSC